jgi:hypothetical protein
MAAIFPTWKQELPQATANTALTGTVKIRLVSSTYTYSAAHVFISDTTGQITGTTDQTLGTKTYVAGKFSSANATFTAVTTGQTINACLIYVDTGTTTTSRLVAYLDGFTQATNGGDIVVAPNGSNGWLTL